MSESQPFSFRQVELRTLRSGPWQPRATFDPAALRELAANIGAIGLQNPLIVTPAGQLVAGERRARALMALALVQAKVYPSLDDAVAYCAGTPLADVAWRLPPISARVWCRIVEGSDRELQEIALVDNLQREDLSPLDEAAALKRMLDEHGYSQRQLGDIVGKSQTYISHRLVLLDLAPELTAQVLAGELDATAAREFARLAPAVQLSARQFAVKQGYTGRQVKACVERLLDMAEPASWQGGHDDVGRANLLIGKTLERQAPAERQATALTIGAGNAGTGGQIARPKDQWQARRALVQIGLDKDEYGAVDRAWAAQAPTLVGVSCANCQLQPYGERFQAARDLCRQSSTRVPEDFPQCAPGVNVCRAHHAAGAPIRLRVPYDRDAAGSYSHHVLNPDDGYYWHKEVDDVEAALAITELTARHAVTEAQRQADQRAHGLARAIAELAADQWLVEGSRHPFNQPCRLCAFHVRGREAAGSCTYQQHPPRFESYGAENHFAQLYRGDDGQTIARCALFKLRHLERLPAPADGSEGLSGPLPVLLEIFRRAGTAYGQTTYGPRWLNTGGAASRQSDRGSAWGETAAYLTAELGKLSPAQRLLLLSLWGSSMERSAVDAVSAEPDPLDGRPQKWTCIAVYGQAGTHRQAQAFPQPLAEVFAAEAAAEAEAEEPGELSL